MQPEQNQATKDVPTEPAPESVPDPAPITMTTATPAAQSQQPNQQPFVIRPNSSNFAAGTKSKLKINLGVIMAALAVVVGTHYSLVSSQGLNTALVVDLFAVPLIIVLVIVATIYISKYRSGMEIKVEGNTLFTTSPITFKKSQHDLSEIKAIILVDNFSAYGSNMGDAFIILDKQNNIITQINTQYFADGPTKLANFLSSKTGLKINHYPTLKKEDLSKM